LEVTRISTDIVSSEREGVQRSDIGFVIDEVEKEPRDLDMGPEIPSIHQRPALGALRSGQVLLSRNLHAIYCPVSVVLLLESLSKFPRGRLQVVSHAAPAQSPC
jgi:hypothetical protein